GRQSGDAMSEWSCELIPGLTSRARNFCSGRMRQYVLGHALDVRSQPREFFFQTLVTPIEMMNAADDRFAVGGEAGENKGSTGAQVTGSHVSTDEIRGAINGGPIGSLIDLGAEAS